jgi:ABC-type transport system involved in multi-copper enzyme maturation permease subunit
LTERKPLNPVLARELRIRLRGRQAWILLTLYLLLLAFTLFLVYQAESGSLGGNDPFSIPSATRFASVGRSVFEALMMIMLLLVLFLVPGFTSGALAGERERQTLVPLQVTLMRPWQIVVGKLAASFAFLALLVVATAPFLAVAYLIGGVTAGAVLRGVGVVLFTGLTLAGITVCCSALFKRVQIATVVAYAATLFLVLGTVLLWAAAGVVDSSRGDDAADPPVAFLALNPLFLTADVLAEADLGFRNGTSSPFEPLEDVLTDSPDFGGGGVIIDDFGGPVPGPGGGFIGVARAAGGGFDDEPIGFDEFGNPIFGGADDDFPFWALSMIALYSVAVLATLVAIRRLRTPAQVER